MQFSIQVITNPRPETWPRAIVLVLVIVLGAAARTGALPPDVIMCTLASLLAAARSALPTPQEPAEIWRPSWA